MARGHIVMLVWSVVALTSPSPSAQGLPPQEPTPRPVRTITAKTQPSASMSFAGIVQARVETDLAFRTLGRVVSRKVDVGDLVSKGDVVAEIDPLALKLAVTSAVADLRNAQAELENASITERRKRVLASTSAGSVADSDLAELGLRTAEANLAEAQAKLSKAREQLGYAELRSEFDGVVTARSAEVGQVVTAGQSIVKVARLDQRDVAIDVPEAQLSSLRLGTRFEIALQLDGTRRTSGRLREIGPQADGTTRTHRLKIAVDDAPEIFRLGAVVTATAMDGPSGGVMVLPASSILVRDGVSHVWVVDQERHVVSLRTVQLEGISTDVSQVRVLSGLREGEEVAAAGVNRLAEGQKIRLGRERAGE